MEVCEKQRLENIEKWRNLISEFEASNMSVTAWCKHNGINKGTYYEWKKKLSRLDNLATREFQIAQICIPEEKPANSASIKVHSNGIKIEISKDANIEHIKILMEVLSNA